MLNIARRLYLEIGDGCRVICYYWLSFMSEEDEGSCDLFIFVSSRVTPQSQIMAPTGSTGTPVSL